MRRAIFRHINLIVAFVYYIPHGMSVLLRSFVATILFSRNDVFIIPPGRAVKDVGAKSGNLF